MSEKLDRLIGERVMGWTVRESEPDDYDYERYSSEWAVCRWNPSTCIKTAWEVRAEMKRRGFWLLLIDMNDGTWHAAFKSVEPDGRCIYSSECVAICLAALRAVGVPESEIEESMR